MQRSIVKTRVGSDVAMAIKMERPRMLASKKCVDVWSAACDNFPLFKLAGHKGNSLSVYLQDGLFSVPFAKRMHSRHSLFFEKKHCPIRFESDTDREISELKDWVFSFTCVAHASSRSLKGGLKSLFLGGDQSVEDIHVTVSSLLRASAGPSLAVPEFIVVL